MSQYYKQMQHGNNEARRLLERVLFNPGHILRL